MIDRHTSVLLALARRSLNKLNAYDETPSNAGVESREALEDALRRTRGRLADALARRTSISALRRARPSSRIVKNPRTRLGTFTSEEEAAAAADQVNTEQGGPGFLVKFKGDDVNPQTPYAYTAKRESDGPWSVVLTPQPGTG